MSFSTYGALLTVPITKGITFSGAVYTANTLAGDYGGD